MTLRSVKCGISSLGCYLALVASFVGVVNGCWQEYNGTYCLGLSGDHESGSTSLEACQARCRSSPCAAITYYAYPQACYIAATRCDVNTSSAGGKVLVNHCQEIACPEHIMVSNLETDSYSPFADEMYGLYSRVDGESYNKRPKYRRDSYRGHFDLFYSDSDSSYLDWVVGGTWAITKRYDENEYSAPHLDWLAHGERSRVGVISFVQFATCPHHATRFCESQVPGVAGNGYVLRNISMQEISLPTPAPKPFAEIAAEWLRGNYFCIFLPFFPFLVMGVWFWLLHFEMIVMFTRILMGKAISPAQTKVEQTLEEIKQVLESPDRLPTFCENPRSLESLESSVTETIAEKQELLHYYKQKDDQVFRFAAIPLQVGSICLNVYMWVCLAYIVFENVSGLRDELYGRSFSSGGDIHWLTVFAFWLSYVMVLIESFCTFPQEIRDVREVQQARTVIDRMLRLEPLLRMQACQDHLETRPLPLHQFIPLRHWRDLSVGDVLGASNRGVTRLFVESIICAGDKRTLEIIDSRYAQFEEEHHAFVKCELPAFQKRLIICDNNPPWWMNRKVFYLASFLGLTWIYRFCLKMMTSSSTLVLVKQVFVDDTDTSEA